MYKMHYRVDTYSVKLKRGGFSCYWPESVRVAGSRLKQTTSNRNVHVLFVFNDCLDRRKTTLKHIRHYHHLDAILFNKFCVRSYDRDLSI